MAVARTVKQAIEASLRVIGILGATESITTHDENIGFAVLQDLISEWSGQGLMIPHYTPDIITLVVSQSDYYIGENGTPDLNTVRPIRIDSAFVRDSSNYDHPVKIIGKIDYIIFDFHE